MVRSKFLKPNLHELRHYDYDEKMFNYNKLPFNVDEKTLIMLDFDGTILGKIHNTQRQLPSYIKDPPIHLKYRYIADLGSNESLYKTDFIYGSILDKLQNKQPDVYHTMTKN